MTEEDLRAEVDRLRVEVATPKEGSTLFEFLDIAVMSHWYALMAEAGRRGITLYEVMQLPWEELQDVGK